MVSILYAAENGPQNCSKYYTNLSKWPFLLPKSNYFKPETRNMYDEQK